MKTAVIGLGAMGAGIAANLHRAGQLYLAWNRTRSRGGKVAATCGLTLADDLDQLAAADLIICSVSADADLLEIAGRLAELLRPGTIVLDTSTVSADTAVRVATLLASRGIHFLDGPVSGGKEGAENGQLAMMVGGDATILEQIRPVLASFTRQVTHMGQIGNGQATKAVNQIMAAGINQAVSEALAFGQAQHLDLDKVIEVVSQGAAGNWFLEHRGPNMIRGIFEPGFKLALHHKDLKICQAMATEHAAHLPIVEMTLVHYQRLIEAGHGDADISMLFQSKQALFKDDE